MRRRLLLTLACCAVASVILVAALPAIDALAGAYSPGDPLSGSWTVLNGSFASQASTSFAGASVSTASMAKWSADSFPNDQYAQLKIVLKSTSFTGVMVRTTGTGGSTNAMLFATDTFGDTGLYQETGLTTGSRLTTSSTEPATGDTIRLDVSSNVYTLKLDVGSTGSFSTVGTYTDGGSLATSGAAAIYTNDTTNHFNAFKADSLSAGGATPCLRALLGVGCLP